MLLWLWRGFLAAALVWALLSFSYIAVAVVAVWVATEVAVRGRRHPLRP
jgi:hypothetical protein